MLPQKNNCSIRCSAFSANHYSYTTTIFYFLYIAIMHENIFYISLLMTSKCNIEKLHLWETISLEVRELTRIHRFLSLQLVIRWKSRLGSRDRQRRQQRMLIRWEKISISSWSLRRFEFNAITGWQRVKQIAPFTEEHNAELNGFQTSLCTPHIW